MKLKPLVAGLVLAATVIPTAYADYGNRGAEMFRHIATFDVTRNGEGGVVSEVAEIVDVTKDGKALIYTDSETGNIGFVDISYPRDPRPDGLLDVRAIIGEERVGEPTGVAVRGRYALVGLDTSATVTCTPAGDPDETISVITDWTGQLVPANYPQIASANDGDGLPIAWVALFDLVGDPEYRHTL